jgi:uncharacterized membrane protein
MPPLMLASVGSASVSALLANQRRQRLLRWLGVACATLPIVITRIGNVPLNEAMAGWSADEPPRQWRDVVARWDRWNLLRTLAAVSTFVCEVASAVR